VRNVFFQKISIAHQSRNKSKKILCGGGGSKTQEICQKRCKCGNAKESGSVTNASLQVASLFLQATTFFNFD